MVERPDVAEDQDVPEDRDAGAVYAATVQSAMQSESVDRPRVQRWEDIEPDWNAVPGADRSGNRRGLYPRTYGSHFLGRYVTVPPGQRSPKHINSAEHIVVQLEGTAEFSFPDTPEHEAIRITPRDVLFFPANIPYEYANVGDVDVLWFTVIGMKDQWPPTQHFLREPPDSLIPG